MGRADDAHRERRSRRLTAPLRPAAEPASSPSLSGATVRLAHRWRAAARMLAAAFLLLGAETAQAQTTGPCTTDQLRSARGCSGCQHSDFGAAAWDEGKVTFYGKTVNGVRQRYKPPGEILGARGLQLKMDGQDIPYGKAQPDGGTAWYGADHPGGFTMVSIVNGHFSSAHNGTPFRVWLNGGTDQPGRLSTTGVTEFVNWDSNNIEIWTADWHYCHVVHNARHGLPEGASAAQGESIDVVPNQLAPTALSTHIPNPSVESVYIFSDPGDDDTYHLKEKIRVAVRFDEPVKVNTNKGTPRLRIDMTSGDGGVERASYVTGSGTQELLFEYQVRKRNTSTEGIAIIANSLNLGGGRIRHAQYPELQAELAHAGVDHDPTHMVSPAEAAEQAVAFSSAFINRDKVVLTFEEDLARLSASQLSDLRYAFTVTGAELDQHPATMEHHATRNDRILMRLGTPARRGQNVSVRYAGSHTPFRLRTSDGRTIPNFTTRLENRTTVGVHNTTVSISDASVQEGPDANLLFRLSLNHPAPDNLVVTYRTEDISATNGEDYRGTEGRVDHWGESMPDSESVSFWKGDKEYTIVIPVIDDDIDEGDETFRVKLISATGVQIADRIGIGTITDSEPAEEEGAPVGLSTASAPTVTGVSVVSSPASGSTYMPGETIRIRATFDQAVQVTGSPQISIDMDPAAWGEKQAAYEKGSGTATLDFTHTVVEPNYSTQGIAVLANTLALNGGAIRSADTHADAELGHTGLGHASGHKVDWRPSISVADARADEGAGATVAFQVSLSRAFTTAGHRVTVDYATADGSAKAGEDYTAASGTLTFAPGETSKSVPVPVLDDAHDEGEETLTLRLSNASGATLANAEATGTIENSDPLPRAWLARFGRTGAVHIVDILDSRFDSASPAGDRLVLGGRAVDTSLFPRRRESSEIESRPAGDTVSHWMPEQVRHDGEETGDTDPHWMPEQVRHDGEETGDTSDYVPVGAGASATALERALWQALTNPGALDVDKRFLSQSSFQLSLTDLSSEHSPSSFPRRRESSGQGVAEGDSVSHWMPEQVRHDGGGEARPGGTSEAQPIETDLSLSMGAMGVKGIVLATATTELAIKSDALWVRTASETTDGLQGAVADTSRIRLLLTGRHQRLLPNDALLSPTFELGIRYDDGDAETGFGMELGGGLQYADPVLGLTAETRARTLIAHEDGGYEEWGLGGSLSLDPGRLGRGLALRLDSGWGIARSNAEALWQRQSTAGMAPQQGPAAQGRFNAELGYGLDVPWTYAILTPYGGMEWAGPRRALRLGWRFDLGQRLNLSVEGERIENGYEHADHSLMLRTALPW